MFPFAWIGVLIKMSAVKESQSMIIPRKVRGYPVKENTNTLLMHIIHKVLKVFRRTETTGWRIVARYLVPPRAVVRELGNRHQFDRSESLILAYLCQRKRQFTK